MGLKCGPLPVLQTLRDKEPFSRRGGFPKGTGDVSGRCRNRLDRGLAVPAPAFCFFHCITPLWICFAPASVAWTVVIAQHAAHRCSARGLLLGLSTSLKVSVAKRRSHAGLGLDPDSAAVALDNFLADGQAHPYRNILLYRGTSENDRSFGKLRFDADTVILHLKVQNHSP